MSTVRRALTCSPYFHRTIGRERRERVSQLTWCGEGALIRAAASTQPLCGFLNLGF